MKDLDTIDLLARLQKLTQHSMQELKAVYEAQLGLAELMSYDIDNFKKKAN